MPDANPICRPGDILTAVQFQGLGMAVRQWLVASSGRPAAAIGAARTTGRIDLQIITPALRFCALAVDGDGQVQPDLTGTEGGVHHVAAELPPPGTEGHLRIRWSDKLSESIPCLVSLEGTDRYIDLCANSLAVLDALDPRIRGLAEELVGWVRSWAAGQGDATAWEALSSVWALQLALRNPHSTSIAWLFAVISAMGEAVSRNTGTTAADARTVPSADLDHPAACLRAGIFAVLDTVRPLDRRISYNRPLLEFALATGSFSCLVEQDNRQRVVVRIPEQSQEWMIISRKAKASQSS